MDEAKGQNKNMMVYTPEHRIPLGEAVKRVPVSMP